MTDAKARAIGVLVGALRVWLCRPPLLGAGGVLRAGGPRVETLDGLDAIADLLRPDTKACPHCRSLIRDGDTHGVEMDYGILCSIATLGEFVRERESAHAVGVCLSCGAEYSLEHCDTRALNMLERNGRREVEFRRCIRCVTCSIPALDADFWLRMALARGNTDVPQTRTPVFQLGEAIANLERAAWSRSRTQVRAAWAILEQLGLKRPAAFQSGGSAASVCQRTGDQPI